MPWCWTKTAVTPGNGYVYFSFYFFIYRWHYLAAIYTTMLSDGGNRKKQCECVQTRWTSTLPFFKFFLCIYSSIYWNRLWVQYISLELWHQQAPLISCQPFLLLQAHKDWVLVNPVFVRFFCLFAHCAQRDGHAPSLSFSDVKRFPTTNHICLSSLRKPVKT